MFLSALTILTFLLSVASAANTTVDGDDDIASYLSYTNQTSLGASILNDTTPGTFEYYLKTGFDYLKGKNEQLLVMIIDASAPGSPPGTDATKYQSMSIAFDIGGSAGTHNSIQSPTRWSPPTYGTGMESLSRGFQEYWHWQLLLRPQYSLQAAFAKARAAGMTENWGEITIAKFRYPSGVATKQIFYALHPSEISGPDYWVYVPLHGPVYVDGAPRTVAGRQFSQMVKDSDKTVTEFA